MRFSIHRKEQYDLECWPLVCIHAQGTTPSGNRYSKRVLCVWLWGLQVGSRVFARGN